MKHWGVTTNMSQNLTSFSVFTIRQISRFAKAEREKIIEDGKTSFMMVTEEKPLLPVDSWLIQMAFKEFREKYADIENVEIIEIEIAVLNR